MLLFHEVEAIYIIGSVQCASLMSIFATAESGRTFRQLQEYHLKITETVILMSFDDIEFQHE